MSWFKDKSPPPSIPQYGKRPPLEPKQEPMQVEEERNPSDSMIVRFIKKLKGEDKGEDEE